MFKFLYKALHKVDVEPQGDDFIEDDGYLYKEDETDEVIAVEGGDENATDS